MNKRSVIVLSTVIVVFAIIGYILYLLIAAANEKAGFDCDMKSRSVPVAKENLYLVPQEIDLGLSSTSGYIVHFQDYSLTICGYNDVRMDEDLNDDDISLYHIDNDKLLSCNDMSKMMSIEMLDYSDSRLQVEKAVGKKIDTEIELYQVSVYSTPNDFTLLDRDINRGIRFLLNQKLSIILHFDVYQFDNGVIRGFLRSVPDKHTFVEFSNYAKPYSFYRVTMVGFTMDEMKEIISTIVFDKK